MRLLLIILIFFTNAFSNDSDKIIKDILFSKDNKTFISINKVKEKDILKDFYLKLIIDKSKIKEKKYYLRVNHHLNAIKSISVNALQKDNELIIEITKNTPLSILMNIKVEKNLSAYVNLNIYTKSQYKIIANYEKLFLGLCYGIIFCAFLYNFVLFLFTKQKAFFYYSFLQISLMFFLISINLALPFFYYLVDYINIVDLFSNLSIIFAILFSRAFLETKKNLPKLDKILILILFLYLIDLLLVIIFNTVVFDEFIPNSLILALLVFSSFLVYKKGYNYVIFYTLGWTIILMSILLIEYSIFETKEIYILHLAISLESLILSFTLAYKMRALEKQNIVQEKILIHKSKLASMGEMINNIAHQYRQPLTNLAYVLMNIKSAFEHKQLDEKYLDKKIQEANSQLIFLSNTIDSFNDFYKPKSKKEKFSLLHSINEAILILKPILNEKQITMTVNVDKDFRICGYENEFSQVILNLLSNAKDALLKDEVKEPEIKVYMEQNRLFIKDNAKGVPKDFEKKIFEPYFSTKEKNSGIGLYLSSLIIKEHFDGKLYLKNSEEGATFIIEV